ncbi:hypothetical protein OUZ56_029378 [Daphnia magna]|uniref:HAT C-terminal dimerisation domain-containing protein n=1 Tax=Daphnia magna TaxID=35525 RepID=A0ABR0B6N1_9CRUS|nr:hypothetical protein OUZ56_029378 [Daphnia magna]
MPFEDEPVLIILRKRVLTQKLDGKPRDPNCSFCISFLFSMPFSNATAERELSAFKLIKTDHRNSLNNVTVTSLMRIKHWGVNEDHFASNVVIKKYLSIKRHRSGRRRQWSNGLRRHLLRSLGQHRLTSRLSLPGRLSLPSHISLPGRISLVSQQNFTIQQSFAVQLSVTDRFNLHGRLRMTNRISLTIRPSLNDQICNEFAIKFNLFEKGFTSDPPGDTGSDGVGTGGVDGGGTGEVDGGGTGCPSMDLTTSPVGSASI